MELKPGTKIGGYQIVKLLGKGAIGTVYKAIQLSMNRPVALKVLNEKYTRNKFFIESFLKEARASGKFSHPNLINIFDVGEEKGIYFYSMVYVEGVTLKDILKRQKKIPWKKALEIANEITNALIEIHKHGFIHRDIKPENIMIDINQKVYLADLGCVQLIEEKEKKKIIAGTPYYMSPEQIKGQKALPSSDIYGLGATLYHAILGQPMYEGTREEVMKKQLTGKFPRPIELDPSLPMRVNNLLLNMLAPDPRYRYKTALALKKDIENAINGKNVKPPVYFLGKKKTTVPSQSQSTSQKVLYIIMFLFIFGILAYTLFNIGGYRQDFETKKQLRYIESLIEKGEVFKARDLFEKIDKKSILLQGVIEDVKEKLTEALNKKAREDIKEYEKFAKSHKDNPYLILKKIDEILAKYPDLSSVKWLEIERQKILKYIERQKNASNSY